MSENAINKVQNILLEKNKNVLRIDQEQRERPRSKINRNEENYFLRNDSSSELKLGSAHQRSHQRAHSADPALMSPEKKKAVSANGGIARQLKEQFQVAYENFIIRYGKRSRDR